MTQAANTIAPAALYLAMGEVTSLLAQSELHANRPIGHIGELILPALVRGQIRIWRSEQGPVGFATWAFLNEEIEKKVLEEDYLPQDDEWNCGDRPVMIDFVAPFGKGFRMARDLSREVFPNRALKSVKRDATGLAQRIVQFPGLDAEGTRISAAAFAA